MNASIPGSAAALSPVRIVAYPSARDIEASRGFYVEALGLEATMERPVLCLSSPANPSAQVILAPTGFGVPPPSFGVDLGDPRAVDAAHGEALRRGLRVVYPLRDEPWGVRRFFVEDPGGTVVNVLAHNQDRQAPTSEPPVERATSAAYRPPAASSSSCVPRSTMRPRSSTTI